MQHSALTAERWARFTFAQQILSIAAEMLRANSALIPERRAALCNGYERVLRLVDLSIECTDRRGRRRELLLWRDLIAELYVAPTPDPQAHGAALRVLLLFTPESAKQIPFVTLSR
jgi:hypothetical protein